MYTSGHTFSLPGALPSWGAGARIDGVGAGRVELRQRLRAVAETGIGLHVHALDAAGIDEVVDVHRRQHQLDRAVDVTHRQAHRLRPGTRSEEHTSELQSLIPISYAFLCLTKKQNK